MSEISDFTKLVLDRMETNSDEFVSIGSSYTRWDGLVRGLEELARGDTDGRFIKVLWPLTDEERGMLLEKYRKIYLAELHKDMLKSIVSGNDKEQRTYQYSEAMRLDSRGSLGIGTSSGFIATPIAKAEGAAVNPVLTVRDSPASLTLGKTTLTENDLKKIKASTTSAKFTLTQSQHIIAKQMGISPYEYAQRLAKYEALDND